MLLKVSNHTEEKKLLASHIQYSSQQRREKNVGVGAFVIVCALFAEK